MKNFFAYRYLLFFSMLTAGLIACADSSHPPHEAGKQKDEKEMIVKGKLLAYSSGDAGDIDGLVMSSDGKNISLHFPPHAAQKIMEIAKPSSVLQATVTERRGPEGDTPAYELIALTAANKMIDVRDIPPPLPQRGKEVTVAGKAAEINADPGGRIRSFVVNKNLVMLPPHVGMNVAGSLRDAVSVTVKGYKRTVESGFVNSRGFDIIRPLSISVDSITYTIE